MRIFHQADNINKKIEIIKKEQNRIFGVEKYKNWNEKFARGAQNIFELTKERKAELEDSLLRLRRLRNRKEKKMGKNKWCLRNLWNIIRCICIMRVAEEKVREKGWKIFEGIIADIFQIWWKTFICIFKNLKKLQVV